MEKRHYNDLTGVAVADAAPKNLSGAVDMFNTSVDHVVTTEIGPCVVRVCGDTSAPLAVVTSHELGLDPESTFGNWIHHPLMSPIHKHACWYHILLPGHALGAANVTFKYTLDDLAKQVAAVVAWFKLRQIVGVGCGVGGNILLRCIIGKMVRFKGVLLAGTIGSGQTWSAWGRSWLNPMGPGEAPLAGYEEDNLVTGFVGHSAASTDLAEILKGCLRARNPANVRLLQHVYENRDPIVDKATKRLKGLPVLFLVGYEFQDMPQATNMYDVMDASCSSYLKIPFAACLVHEQFPDQVAKAFKLFLQGAISDLTVALQTS